jgi:hypothetical protein
MARKLFLAVLFLLPAGTVFGQVSIDPDLYIRARGDANNSHSINITDVNYISNWLFSGGPQPPCKNQADVNNDGTITLTDAIYLSNWLFNGGSQPPAPGPYNTVCVGDDLPAPGCTTDPCG